MITGKKRKTASKFKVYKSLGASSNFASVKIESSSFSPTLI
jgi:hypothetical protein